MSTIAVKNVDEQVFRKTKALASLKGKTMGQVVNEALALWLRLNASGAPMEKWERLEDEARINNETYEKEEKRLLARNMGEYVTVAAGKIVGVYKKAEGAFASARRVGAGHAIATRIEEKPTKVVELGWSILEQLA